MAYSVRLMSEADRAPWAAMRARLWPSVAAPRHRDEIDAMLASDRAWGFVAEDIDGEPAGFAEVAVRDDANRCDSRPVAVLEGIWVASPYRRQGIGRALLAFIAAFLRARGHVELGSDTELDNRAAQAAHRGWGFAETERVVYFRKELK